MLHEWVLRIGHDPIRVLFQFIHVFDYSGFRLGLGTCRHLGADGLLEVTIEALLGIQFRAVPQGLSLAVTGRIEQFDFVLALCYPGYDWLAGMNPRVIQNQECLSAGIPGPGFKKLN